jgi:hypothetical protein
MSRSRIVAIMLSGLLVAAGCAGRKAAATQPGTFDVARSDAKAVAIADQVLGAVGGEAAWNNAKEIIWAQAVIVDGKVKDASKHSWDRWNGRHRFTRIDPSGSMGTTMHDLFDGSGTAMVEDAEGNRANAMAEQRKSMMAEAKKRWASDSYLLAMPFKLKDPGVQLSYVEERRDLASTSTEDPMKYDVIKVSFDQGVGPAPGDVYYLLVDKESHLPDVIEYVPTGKSDDQRIGYRLTNWTEVGGLKFSTVRENIGFTMQPNAQQGPIDIPAPMRAAVGELPPIQVTVPGEAFLFFSIEVRTSPTNELYVPEVAAPTQG